MNVGEVGPWGAVSEGKMTLGLKPVLRASVVRD